MTEDEKEHTVVVRSPIAHADGGWSPHFGDHTSELGEHLRRAEVLEGEEFRRVREEARRVLTQALCPSGDPGRRTGIVIGYVQSGKTVSMTAVSALAFDNGFRLIIAFSGTTKTLHAQSVERFERDLRGCDVGHQNWVVLANPTVSANRQDLARLVDEWRSGLVPVGDQQALFIIVMKHHSHLAELERLLRTTSLAGVTSLIIDDEADQAGLDTRPGTPNPSTTYRKIREVRAALPRHTYLQYTATPQAPLLISLADMLSPEFAEILEPGEGYTGGVAFFEQHPQLVRAIPVADASHSAAEPPASLLEALRLFFVGVAAHMLDRRNEKHRSMLIHPTRLTPPQGQYTLWVQRITDRWRQVLGLPPDDAEREELLDELRVAYQDIARTEPRLPSFDDLVAKMPVAVTRIVVTEVNSTTGHEVDWKRGPYHILVGGDKMNRGYTVKGLVVTYMPRPPGTWTADTIQQRARFFGYKQRYLGFCRVYLPPDLIDAYGWYVKHEENVRAQLRGFRGKPLREWRRAFFLEDQFQPTRRNVLTDPLFSFPAPAGWFEQEYPHFSPDAIELNRGKVERYLAGLDWAPHEHERHKVALRTPLHRVLRDLLVDYSFRGGHDVRGSMATLCRIADHLLTHPAAQCTVIRIDADRDARKRTARDNDKAVDLHQGRDPRGDGYPGDSEIQDPGCVTLQVHRLNVHLSDGTIESNVPALAIHIPANFEGDVLASPREQ